MQLSEKQKKFCESYLVTNNASQSVQSAGYETKNPASLGWHLLKSPKVLAKLEELRKQVRQVLTKEKYIDKALETFEQLDITEPNSPRFYEIAGKTLGYIGQQTDNKPNQTLNLTQINITGSETQAQLWELTRKLLANE